MPTMTPTSSDLRRALEEILALSRITLADKYLPRKTANVRLQSIAGIATEALR